MTTSPPGRSSSNGDHSFNPSFPGRLPQRSLSSPRSSLVSGIILINGGLDIVRDHTGCGIARITSVLAQLLVIAGVLLIPLSMFVPEVVLFSLPIA